MKTVYVIDDDATTCFLMETKLTSSAFTLRTYTNAQLFLDEITPSQECIYFLDVNMPYPDGFETAKVLLENGVNVSNIFIFTEHSEIKTKFRNGLNIENFIAKNDLNTLFIESLIK